MYIAWGNAKVKPSGDMSAKNNAMMVHGSDHFIPQNV